MLGLERPGCHFQRLRIEKFSALTIALAADRASSKKILRLRLIFVAESKKCQG